MEDEKEEAKEDEEEARDLEANLNSSSVVGIDSPKTMKFIRAVGGQQVLILLDSGATHNFIANRLVTELQIPVQPANFVVILGDSSRVRGEGKCKGVEISVQGIKIIQDFLPFKLGGMDIILGIKWLRQLGVIKTNWGKQIMRFKWKGQNVKLKGDTSLTRLEATVGALLNSMAQGGERFSLKANREHRDSGEEDGAIPSKLAPLIKNFEELFAEPYGLPPKRARDHAIRLVEGA